MAGLAEVVAGLFLLLVILSAGTFLTPLAALVRAAPVPFAGQLADAIQSGQATIQRSVGALAANGLGGIAGTFIALHDRVTAWLNAERALAASVVAALGRIVTTSIPNALQYALWVGQNDFQQLTALIGRQFAQAEADLGRLGAKLESELSTAYQNLGGWVIARLADLQAYTQTLFAQAEREAEQLAAQVEQAAGQAIGEEVQRAQAAEAAVAAAAVRDARAAVDYTQAVAYALGQQLGRTETELRAEAEAARTALEADIAGVGNLIESEIERVIQMEPFHSLLAARQASEEIVRKDVAALVVLAAVEMRKQLADADALRVKLGPLIAQAGTKIGVK